MYLLNSRATYADFTSYFPNGKLLVLYLLLYWYGPTDMQQSPISSSQQRKRRISGWSRQPSTASIHVLLRPTPRTRSSLSVGPLRMVSGGRRTVARAGQASGMRSPMNGSHQSPWTEEGTLEEGEVCGLEPNQIRSITPRTTVIRGPKSPD